jgi:Reverse transcriptase (RNA-dependent DNA polymerase).
MTEREGDKFKIERGVRQGDQISPKLFTSLLENIFQELYWESKYDIKLNGFRLTNLRFADDMVLFARNAQDLQTMIQKP